MKKTSAFLAGLAAVLGLYGFDAVPGVTRGTEFPYAIPASEPAPGLRPAPVRGMVLFVEDPGYSVFGPAIKPDSGWYNTLTRIFQTAPFDWFGPILDPAQNGPDLALMQHYPLVIWNVYDYWWGATQGFPPALTSADQSQIQDYLAAGGKVWLIGQDLILSGVPRPWLNANFHVAAADTDYWNGSSCLVQDRLKTPYQSVTFHADYQANGFWPDALAPDSQAASELVDVVRSQIVALVHPAARPISASFWTIDGRQPDPEPYWDYIVRKMLYAFGLPVAIIDVGTDSINIPHVIFENSIVYPRATFKNNGTDSCVFTVHCRIEPGGYHSQLSVALAPDSARLTAFPDPFIFARGHYTVTVYTQANGDMDHRNDTLTLQVEATNWLHYDDGVTGSVWAWDYQNNGWGVQYPMTNDCFADSIAIYIGDDSWPIPGGDTATFRLYSGAGRPESLHQEIRRVPVNRGSWNFFVLDTTQNFFPAGKDMFIFYVQVGDLPYCPGLVFDRVIDHPGFMWQLYNDSFSVSLPGGDWMIRGHVEPVFGVAEERLVKPVVPDLRIATVTGRQATIEFSLDKVSEVKLRIFDVNGRLRQVLLRGSYPAGRHRRQIRIDQPAGVYFIQFINGERPARTQKIVLTQ